MARSSHSKEARPTTLPKGFVTREAPHDVSFSAVTPASGSGLAQPPGPTLFTHTVNMPFAIEAACCGMSKKTEASRYRSEEHTSELQSLRHLVCRLLLEKKK